MFEDMLRRAKEMIQAWHEWEFQPHPVLGALSTACIYGFGITGLRLFYKLFRERNQENDKHLNTIEKIQFVAVFLMAFDFWSRASEIVHNGYVAQYPHGWYLRSKEVDPDSQDTLYDILVNLRSSSGRDRCEKRADRARIFFYRNPDLKNARFYCQLMTDDHAREEHAKEMKENATE